MDSLQPDQYIDESSPNTLGGQDACCTGDYSEYQGVPINDACYHNCWDQANTNNFNDGNIDSSIHQDVDNSSMQDGHSNISHYSPGNDLPEPCPSIDVCQPEGIHNDASFLENSTDSYNNSSYQSDHLQVAVVGEYNAGKSTFLNAILEDSVC